MALTNAPHQITARARDAAGNLTTSAAVSVTASNVPKAVIATPAAGAAIGGSQVNVTYSAIGDLASAGVDHIHFILDTNPQVMDRPMDGAYTFADVPPGSHTLQAFLVTSSHIKIPGTDATPVSFTTLAADMTAPAVSISAPTGGAAVSGTVAVAATATDNVSVAGVRFMLDGTTLGVEDTTAPFAISWNTAGTAPGPHVLTAVARDAAGNSAASAGVTVTVGGSSDASTLGRWDAPFELGIVAVNAVLTHTGSVLMFSGDYVSSFAEKVWDPVTGIIRDVPLNRTNLFCAGQAQLADGRILVIGGHDKAGGILGDAESNIFDPVTQTWTTAATMAYRRWYPTATTLADGRVLALSGGTTCLTCIADVPEVYDPRTNRWTALNSSRLSVPYYPFVYQLPNGLVVDAGANESAVATRTLNMTTGAWTMVDPVAVDGHSSVMYRPGKIMKSGTATDSGGTKAVASTAYVIDMNGGSPAWRQVPSMAFPRAFHNSVILPTGDVLIVGGGTRADGLNTAYSVYEAELWSAATESWQTLARMQVPRLYHSTALLLPDGRVLSAGSGNDSGGVDQTRGQIFSPPYLFKGPRPTITGTPGVVAYGSTFLVQTPDAAAIQSIALVRPGAPTHGFDEDQRYVDLPFTRQSGALSVTAPPNGNYAPPGYYMLFVVTNGVPSVAAWVRFPGPAEDSHPPSAVSGLTATGGIGSISLVWSPASDDIGVAAYNVHRGTSASVTPTPANRVARVTATTTIDIVSAGTYYYVVTAEDAAGNVGTPSAVVSASAITDTVPPTVSLTSPANGTGLTQSVTLTANAGDNVGVAGVTFRVDGAPVGGEDTASPFSLVWSTATVANGAHQITAVARDAAGNTAESVPVSVSVSNSTSTPGLVAAYGFDEGAGISALDGSGNNNTGAVSGTQWIAAGRFGGALSFNGTSSLVSVSDSASLDLTTAMTLEAWVQPAAVGGWRTALLKERPQGLAYALYAHEDPSGPAGYVNVQGDRAVGGTGALTVGQWTHLAMTYDGATLRLFLNGVQVASRAQTGAATVSTGMLRIGGNSIWGEYFQGVIDEVRIYNRALMASEIQTDMAVPVTR